MDQKITQLTELTTPASGDLFAVVDDPGGSPVTKKITIDNLDLSLMDGAPAGDIVGTTDTQTLTNKTLNSPTVNYGDSMPSTDVRCRAYLSSDQSISASTVTKVDFNTESYDSGSDFDTSNNEFTAPVTGYYLIITSIQWGAYAEQDNDTYYTYIYNNGSVIKEDRYLSPNSTGRNTFNCQDIVNLSANDVIDIRVEHNASSSINISHGEDFSFLAIHLLST